MNGEEKGQEWGIEAQVELTEMLMGWIGIVQEEFKLKPVLLLLLYILAWMIGKFDSQKD